MLFRSKKLRNDGAKQVILIVSHGIFSKGFRPFIGTIDDIHTFKTQYKDIEYYRAGVCLFPKNSSVSQKEFDFRLFINKKEIFI